MAQVIVVILLVGWLFSGCSRDLSESEVSAVKDCIKNIDNNLPQLIETQNSSLQKVKEWTARQPESLKEADQLDANNYSEYVTKLKEGRETLVKGSKGEDLDSDLHTEVKSLLSSDTCEKSYLPGPSLETSARYQARRDEAEMVYQEVDAAQDAVIEEYRKKSVKHVQSVAGSGVKVDAFVMKDGSVVYCKTSVTDGGKAVSCN